MPRGSNSEVETGRVSSKEMGGDRPKGGTGTVPNEKVGFGSKGSSMQKNPAKMKAPKF
jgi:hypothetical protein